MSGVVYLCPYCQQSFLSRENFLSHVIENHANQEVDIPTSSAPPGKEKCKFCPKIFGSKGARVVHERVHTGVKPYQCSFCPEAFTRKDAQQMHEFLHTGERPFKCGFCDKRFTKKSGVKSHERLHTGDLPYPCRIPLCEKKFISESARRKHETCVHAEKKKKVQDFEFYAQEIAQINTENDEIEIEGNPQTDQIEIEEHDYQEEIPEMRVVDEIHEMEEIPEFQNLEEIEEDPVKIKFQDITKVETEIKSEEIDADWECDPGEIKLEDVELQDLKPIVSLHVKKEAEDYQKVVVQNTENRRKQFGAHQCSYCFESFSTEKDKKSHEGLHLERRKWQCQYCPKSYQSSKNRDDHERSHTGEKPFKCRFCPKAYARKDSRTSHERLHTGEKPYYCKYCGKSFNRREAAKIHERGHTGERFECNECNFSALTKSAVRTHYKNVHGEKEEDQIVMYPQDSRFSVIAE